MAVLSLFVILMGVIVLWPQPGYIHPDEFFQSIEVVAGDIFNITHLRTWEFNPEKPIRDISLPYVLFAPAFYALRAALSSPLVSGLISESYVVTILPRLIIAVAGILNYRLVTKLCKFFAVEEKTAVWYWLTSYVTWTFLTRSFSNTTETLLFSATCILLLDLAQACSRVRCVRVSGQSTPAEEESVKPEHQTLRKCSFLLGTLLCMGVFNRPTFPFFVGAPLLWWLDQLTSAGLKKVSVVMTMFLTGMGFLFMFFILSVGNSLYYDPEVCHLFSDLHVAVVQWDTPVIQHTLSGIFHALRIPPLNFVRYNLQSSNLAEHGVHPWYTHCFINFPILLGPLCLLFFWNLAALLRHFLSKHPADVLYAVVVFPVLGLSLFAHQEARFLLPVLPVAVVSAARNSVAKWKTFKALTLLFNLIAFVLFGLLHQGGVVPALSALQARMKVMSSDPANSGSNYHIVSYATYMPPRHVLFNNDSRLKLHVHDMIGGHNPQTFKLKMEELISLCNAEHLKCRFYVLLPATAMSELTSLTNYRVIEEGRFCPHLSMERLPTNFSLQSKEDLFDLLPQFCLKLMSVKR